eukprot:Plantae.Rhodophyta-Hildenbrandia_rubra.ctg1412.p2 GENE.Plantae.Rhodophyta-Hildenbrandia_rubra.ctg1412~~Plantae.Rhodophyta-Hildenbrandia_rubra.ctg1412.p2  ORF type:complete len:1364 (+),score=308.33 Plantae.Rhodophyta-Hildenbrandia_rubra.ctg1412:7341-11432(+)
MVSIHTLKPVIPLLLLLILQTPIHAAITQLTIVDVATSKDFGALKSQVYAPADLPASLAIRCDVTGSTKQIEFFVGGKKIRTEKSAPYTISGDTGGKYRPWKVPAGKIVLSAKQIGADDKVADELEVSFEVSDTTTDTGGGTDGGDTGGGTDGGDTGGGGSSTSEIKLVVVDAVTDKDFGPLVDGGKFADGELPEEISLRADVKQVAGAKNSVTFYVDGKAVRTESSVPYAIAGDSKGSYRTWNAPAGGATVKVEHLADGKIVDTLEVTYSVGGDVVVNPPTTTPSPSVGDTVVDPLTPTPSASRAPVIDETESTTPSPSIVEDGGGDAVDEVKVNFGGAAVDGFEADDGVAYIEGSTKASSGAGTGIYKTHRWGGAFTLNFKLTPGTYNVILFFAETYKKNCVAGNRVFDVTVGDEAPLEGLDVFDMVGCEKPYQKTFAGVKVDETLVVKLTKKANNAFISGIQISGGDLPTASPTMTVGASVSPTPTEATTPTDPTTSVDPKVTVSAPPTPTDPDDKGAHAVPEPFDSPIIDKDKDGVQSITLDGSRSHTHYYDAEADEFGTIVNYKWSNIETEEVLCEGPDAVMCKHTFELGSTNVEHCITDNTKDTNCAAIVVTLVESTTPGAYCYYYDDPAATSSGMPLKMGLETEADASPKPAFGASTKKVDFTSIDAFPDFKFKSTSWAQRCVFFFTSAAMDTYQFSIEHTGDVALFVGDEQVISAKGTDASQTSEGVIEIPEGIQKIDLVYYKKGDAAQLQLSSNATSIEYQYDDATVLPIITSVTPNSVGAKGGRVLVEGLNLDNNLEVLFGGEKGGNIIYNKPNSPTSLQVDAPPSSKAGDVGVTLSNAAGTSNKYEFTYNEAGEVENDVVKFTTIVPAFKPKGVTNVAVGPDFKYYMTTFSAKVIVVDLEHEDGYSVKSSCESATLSDDNWIDVNTKKPAQRRALGIAFNPKDKGIKAYVSTSSLYWGPGEQDFLKDDFAWANGNIEVMEPGDGCVKRTGFLVTGLPVSNHDHAINSMVFDNNGDLLVQVGGFTNQGIPGEKLGGIDENPLSAASLLVKTSKGASFDGKITYDNKVPELAKQITGDVEVYASGLRNSFGITLHSNGNLYATDNGPNFSFGKRSTGCNAGDEVKDQTNPDKILQLKKGKYYGSPNRNRGECIFIDDKGKTPSGASPPASLNYELPLAVVKSSTNGIMEYTANTFQGQLRGKLYATKFAGGGSGKGQIWEMGLKGDGSLASGPSGFFDFESGLSVVQGRRGEIIMPKVQQSKIIILKPSYPEPAAVTVIAVTPFRGAKGGGTEVIITGHNFGAAPTATFGGKACTSVTAVTDTSFKCITPAGSGLVDVDVSGASVVDGFWYMNV